MEKKTCKDCIHFKICNDYVYLIGREDKVACPDFKSTEDVVPRSEVEQLQRNLEQCENGYRQQIHLLQCKHKDEVEKLRERLEREAKCQYDLCGQIVDLKQKAERLTIELEAMRDAANSKRNT